MLFLVWTLRGARRDFTRAVTDFCWQNEDVNAAGGSRGEIHRKNTIAEYLRGDCAQVLPENRAFVRVVYK